MARIYRIHPGLGIARLGNSAAEFFVGPEVPGIPSHELAADGSDGPPLSTYKDAQGRIKRQAARFSVWEYERDEASGAEALIGEVKPARATIEWSVGLANTKAAGFAIFGAQPPQRRNPGVPLSQLSITPQYPTIGGANRQATATTSGLFRGQAVDLGELRTDALGRLLVLGGRGLSFSPSNKPITGFANNRDWCDDVADGPVDATLTFADGTRRSVDKGSWVVVAPPDYAPSVLGITTLYDVALDAAVSRGWRHAPAMPSFRDEVLPILQRVAALRFVNQFAQWNSFSRDYALLGTAGNPTADTLRKDTHALLLDIELSSVLDRFAFTARQKTVLALWAQGSFVQDFAVAAPPAIRSPEAIDRAALDATVGGGFFPGIEIGILSTNPELYDEPFRLTRQAFSDNDPSIGAAVQTTLRAGSLTERMACPWQADFMKCSGNWWPAQRPDTVTVRPADPTPSADWDLGIHSHIDLVANFWKLGFLHPATAPNGDSVMVESERDVSLPPR